MSQQRYNVVVSGQPLEGFELEQVKQQFAELFSLAESRVEQIFSRGNVVIKKNAAEPVAHKFIRALEKIGAAAHLHPLPADNQPQKPAEEQRASATVATLQPQSDAAVESPASPASAPTTNPGGGSVAVSVSSEQQAAAAQHPFAFHGNGFEYFKIWIVNILLTILTLGIYSAWAKVRNNQYFYGNTELAGSRFGYHAKPLTILKGRIVAVVVFIAYSLISELNPIAGVVLALLLLVALPWILVRALTFNRRMSSWRNLRFGFDGSLWGAAQAFILWPLAGVLSFGLLYPLAFYKQKAYMINHSRFGTSAFQIQPCVKGFYLLFAGVAGIAVVGAALAFGLAQLAVPLQPLTMLLIYFYLFVFFSVRSTNLVYNNSSLDQGQFGFSCNWRDGSYLKLVLVNSLMTLLTLGFFYPWARVRVAHYKAEHLQIEARQQLDRFVAAQAEQVSALGEEFGDVFDMEVGI